MRNLLSSIPKFVSNILSKLRSRIVNFVVRHQTRLINEEQAMKKMVNSQEKIKNFEQIVALQKRQQIKVFFSKIKFTDL